MTQAVNDLLEQHFDTAFAAPDGIAKLRELILTLAMQGKLVEQDPNDSPASELLKEIEKENQRLIAEKKIKKQKPSLPIKPEEVPYELPQGWEWVRLGGVAEINGGYAFKSSQYTDDGVRVIRISDFDERGFKNDKVVRYPFSSELKSFQLEANNILMAMTGGTVGKSLLVKSMSEPMVVNQRVATIKVYSQVLSDYINGLIRTRLIQSAIQSAKNSTNDNISMSDITGFMVPLPPFSEQHRIVARIDQLMKRCDELEKLRKDREEKRLKVHAAAIKQLLDAPENTGWPFIQQQFGELYTVKENVAELRKAILQLAVMGRLVPQDPNDPPASELLKEIEKENQRLIAEKKIKKQKPSLPIKPEEVPYLLPRGWAWVRVEDVFNTTSGTTFDAALEKEAGSYAYVKVGDMNLQGNELVIETSSRYVDPDEKMLRSLISTGSVIFPKRGGAIATNKKRIIRNPVFVDLNIMAITPIFGVLTEYAYLWLSTLDLALLNTGTSVPQINHKDIDPLPFPIPPLAEQHRIVARIDQLMALCDKLDSQIDAATNKQDVLLNAVMARV